MDLLEQIFNQALALPVSKRKAYINSACGTDDNLRLEVTALVVADAEATNFLGDLGRRLHTVLDDDLSEQLVVGRYRVLEMLGSGGMGAVYRAFDQQLERDVALKFLHPHVVADERSERRFMNEARAVSRLNHPAIAVVHDFGSDASGSPFIVMELCRGQQISSLIEDNSLSYMQSLDIATELCDALAYAHREAVVHRDLKPANLVMTDDGYLKLLDFGAAKIISHDVTESSQTVGTVAYMAPEQFNGQSGGVGCDIWAFGAILFQLLVGQRPFPGDSAASVMKQIFHGPKPSARAQNSQIPESLDALIAHCLEIDLASRAGDIQQVGARLRAIVDSLPDSFDARGRPTVVSSNAAPGSSFSGEKRSVCIVDYQIRATNPDDPEALLDDANDFPDYFSKIVRRFDGYVERNDAKGGTAYFGYPRTHEHMVSQAVRCALALNEASSNRRHRLSGWASSIGIHTGVVIARHRRGQAPEIIGDAASVARKICLNAELDKVIASRATIDLLDRHFEVLSGATSDPETYEIVGELAPKARFNDQAISPLAGRVPELGLLRAAWQRALGGDGAMLTIAGEAGIGKSRLLHELKREVVNGSRGGLIECSCSPHELSTAYFPITRYLHDDVLEFSPGESAIEKRQRIDGLCAQHALDEIDSVLLGDLLGLVREEPSAAGEALSPESTRARIVALFSRLVAARARNQPLCLIFEDLHWVDASTEEFLKQLVRQHMPPNVLLVLTFRPEFQPRWLHVTTGVTQLSLHPLSGEEAASMIRALTQSEPLSSRIRERLIEQADGNPLFIEELSFGSKNWAQDAGQEQIPASLRDSLMGRLDRLAQAKQTAQLAAVIGRDFSAQLLHATSPLARHEVEAHLQQLIDAQLLQRAPGGGENYRFRHALVRDAAYDSLLREDRTRNHALVADMLIADDYGAGEELLAYHCRRAGRGLPAAEYYLQAATNALSRHAVNEAAAMCREGLSVVDGVDNDRAVTELKYQFYVTMGPALMAARGYADDEIEKVYTQALMLCEHDTAIDRRFAVQFGLWSFNCVRANHLAASRFAEAMLGEATNGDDRGIIVEARMARGITRFLRGELLAARDDLGVALATYDPQQHAAHRLSFGQDPAVVTMAFQSWTEWYLGDFSAAVDSSKNSIALARQLNHPMTLAFALTYAAWIELLESRVDDARALVNEAIDVASEHGIKTFQGLASVWRHYFDLLTDPSTQNLAALQLAVERYAATGAGLFLPAWRASIAAEELRVGRLQDAGATLQDAAAGEEKTDERWSEVGRLKAAAEWFRQTGAVDEQVRIETQIESVIEKNHAYGWRRILSSSASTVSR